MADPWRIGVHESGHCVAARLLNLSCGSACIVEPFAQAEFDCDSGERSIIALMAGAAAEVIVFGDHHPRGFADDWKRVTGRLKRAGDDARVPILWARTMGLLRPHERAICRVARGLVSAVRSLATRSTLFWRNIFRARSASKHNDSNARFAVQSDSIWACLIAGVGRCSFA
jgi:hypothetical protein